MVITVTAAEDKKHLPLVKHVLLDIQSSELIKKPLLVRTDLRNHTAEAEPHRLPKLDPSAM